MEFVPMARSSVTTGRIKKAIDELGIFQWDIIAKIVDEALREHSSEAAIQNGEMNAALHLAFDWMGREPVDSYQKAHLESAVAKVKTILASPEKRQCGKVVAVNTMGEVHCSRQVPCDLHE